ncbi:MAG: hypothetical protein O2923_07400 [Verrucomicrobia bacterium]|nr:hypothetical protein [Verrucomicrobiota bacterium]MDA1086958.1 hypothetical protein [Verrucomicrobiota bacterium]
MMALHPKSVAGAMLLGACTLGASSLHAQAPRPASTKDVEYKEYPAVRSQVTVKGKDAIITLRGRSRDKLGVTPGTEDSAARTSLDVNSVEAIKFAMEIDRPALSRAVRTKDWAGAVRVLRDPVSPTLPYLDLNENNAVEYALQLGNYMLRDAEKTLRTSDANDAAEVAEAKFKAAYAVYRQLANVEWHAAGKIGSVKRLLCLLRLNKPKSARRYLDNIEAPLPGDRAYGIYYLVLAELSLHAKDYRAAMEAAVKSLSFETKDIETFPDALLISAQCYEELQQWHRARDVYYEIANIFPATDWSEVSRRRLRYILDKGFTKEEESLPIENVFFAWQEDMNEKATAFLDAGEATVEGAPKGDREDKDVDFDTNEDGGDLDAMQ